MPRALTPPAAGPLLSPAAYARSRHAAWLGAAALFTNAADDILLVEPSYARHWLLPGGAVEPGEFPRQGAEREVAEEIGLSLPLARVLAVDWEIPAAGTPSRERAFPGEQHTVFDGGTLTDADIARLRPAAGEISTIRFFPPEQAAARMRSHDARRMLAAYRARTEGGAPVLLENALAPRVFEQLEAASPFVPVHCQQWPWTPADELPEQLPVRQSWGWLLHPHDGRCVVLLDEQDHLPLLPGGTIEADLDHSDPYAALVREAAEEAQLAIGPGQLLGYVFDADGTFYGGMGPCVRARLAAPLTHIGAAAADPSTGRRLVRLLAPPHQAVDLLGWGDGAHGQAEAALRAARDLWGIRPAAHAPVELIPAEGVRL
ncbi:NUDIX domain-containing protein [Streptomyces sp. NPDC050095]|uniref:NUDIX hydrolase n=1 Tax=unclassified Streptomyces TaxID=2593676 RepID=UPI00341AD946